jgi:sec-independent protein translocase protein TatA
MFGSLGIPELLVILVVVVLLFGAKRIPEIGRALGQTITNFRREVSPRAAPPHEIGHDDARVTHKIQSGELGPERTAQAQSEETRA